MKHMILSFRMKGVISDHFLMLWFQKDSLDTVCLRAFRTFRGGGPKQNCGFWWAKVTFGFLNVSRGGSLI